MWVKVSCFKVSRVPKPNMQVHLTFFNHMIMRIIKKNPKNGQILIFFCQGFLSSKVLKHKPCILHLLYFLCCIFSSLDITVWWWGEGYCSCRAIGRLLNVLYSFKISVQCLDSLTCHRIKPLNTLCISANKFRSISITIICTNHLLTRYSEKKS